MNDDFKHNIDEAKVWSIRTDLAYDDATRYSSDNIPDFIQTEEEIDGNFTLRYIPLNIVNEVSREKMDMSGDTNGITHEMLEVLEYFNKTYV